MTETAFGAAFRRAGYDTKRAQIYTAVVGWLNSPDANRLDYAEHKLREEVDRDPSLIRWLIDDYVRFVRADIKGASRLPGEGQGRDVHDVPNQNCPARRPYEDGGSQTPCAGNSHSSPAPSSSPQEGGEASRFLPKGRDGDAPSPSPEHDRMGRTSIALDGHAWVARPVVPPKEFNLKQRQARATVAQLMTRTIMDTYKLSNGVAIGDVRFGQIDNLISKNVQDSFILKRIKAHVQAPPETPIRDAIKIELLQRLIQLGAEVSDAA